jgi:hypothetical protein
MAEPRDDPPKPIRPEDYEFLEEWMSAIWERDLLSAIEKAERR